MEFSATESPVRTINLTERHKDVQPEKVSDSDELCPVCHGRRRRRVLSWVSPVRTEACEGLTSKRDPQLQHVKTPDESDQESTAPTNQPSSFLTARTRSHFTGSTGVRVDNHVNQNVPTRLETTLA
jgi:hypothetical protein